MNPRPTAYEAAALTGLSYRGAGVSGTSGMAGEFKLYASPYRSA